MKRLGQRIVFALFGLLASGLLTPPLQAQTDPQTAVAWPAQVDDTPDEDLAVVPAAADQTTTLGDPILASDADPALTNFVRDPAADTLIYPLALTAPDPSAQPSTNAHYLSYTYKGTPVLLVGVSADNACHFISPGFAQCSYGTGTQYGSAFKPFLDDLYLQGLNSLRLWVSLVGEGTAARPTATTCPGAPPATVTAVTSGKLTNDNPFQYAGGPLVNGVGRWTLDVKDNEYFNRLADVVSYANKKGILVEVTLFSPLTGNIGIGPYGKDHAYLSNGTKLPGFTDTANFTNLSSAEYQPMSPYLVNVIQWTVDALYKYPNVYFEVANEPENIQASTTNSAGCGNMTATTGATVAAWQSQIANLLTVYEKRKYVTPNGPLAHPHLVAVEPSTISGAAPFMTGGAYASAGQIINSHYTILNPKGIQGTDGLGAIKMIRSYNSQPRIFGFNETKITGGSCGGGSTGGSVEAGRAEAWEFMLGQGGIYDQFGYDCNGVVHTCSTTTNSADAYCRTRIQMGMMRKFLSDPLVNVALGTRTSAPVDNSSTAPQTSGTNWINVGAYPLLADASLKKFWAALEPTSTAANKRWLLYVHHSLRRNLIQGGYQAAMGSYQETNLSVCLLNAPSGTYKVRWYTQPDTAVASMPSRTDTIVWNAPATCIPGGTGAVPLQSSDRYTYDMALLISK